jgi:hypothetical protein
LLGNQDMIPVRVTGAFVLVLAVACESGGASGGDAGGDAGPGDAAAPDAQADAGVPGDAGRPDGALGAGCPAGECNVVTGAGCGSDEGCYLTARDGGTLAPTCAEAGDGREGDSCETLGDCASGYRCDPAVGECRPYCCMGSSSDCPGADQVCAVSLTDADNEPTGVGFCQGCDECDLLSQQGCAEGQGCYPVGQDGCAICIDSGAELSEGQQCRFTNDCAPGLACFGLQDHGETCVRFCDPTAAESACSTEQQCQDLQLEDMDVGYCDPPIMTDGGAG